MRGQRFNCHEVGSALPRILATRSTHIAKLEKGQRSSLRPMSKKIGLLRLRLRQSLAIKNPLCTRRTGFENRKYARLRKSLSAWRWTAKRERTLKPTLLDPITHYSAWYLYFMFHLPIVLTITPAELSLRALQFNHPNLKPSSTSASD
jgi:hypothetical protein